ncbi:MAG TPA: 3-dehydroquinate synthase [Thermoanaerobaculia bacterium]|nr:3-dehydroquinate synthase [Thermoanaerobaculia bacterium]
MEPYTVVRHGHASYPVFIGKDALADVRSVMDDIAGSRPAYLVTTPQVARIAAERLEAVAFAGEPLLLPDGEQAKSLASIEELAGGLISRAVRRDGVLIAVGGGALGDAAGFAASVYLRGIDVVHVPTTLLAQVDSSIGGKTAVNHPMGKNLLGSFHPPIAVIADVGFLDSLSEQELCSGALEALKAGVIGDTNLFDLIELERDSISRRQLEMLEVVVQRAVAVKAGIVSADARESDQRRLLNYGHTIGHGIEAAMNYEGITHGAAVGYGMIGANAVAVARSLLDKGVAARIDEAVRDLHAGDPPPVDVADVLRATEHDKKFGGGKRVMVLPRDIGHCVVVEDISREELHLAAERALAG